MNDIEKLGILYESLDCVEDFLYTNEERDFIETVYSFPIRYPSIEKLNELRDAYLHEYINNPNEIENMISLSEFDLFYNEMKDILIYEENDKLSLPEYTEETLIENGFYKSEFVIHEHNATSFHYDLRWKTRFGSSAYSFAIPKAKMPDENEKILALKQPMHPSVWVDLKGTDTFRDDNNKGPMGSIKLIDRGTIFVKERPKSYTLYLDGEKYKGSYILIFTGNGFKSSNSYMLMKTDKILSDKDARLKEWRTTAFKAFEWQKKKVKEIFNIDCDETILVFENDDNTIDLNNEDEKQEDAYSYIVVPSLENISERRKADSNRIPEQCQADAIAANLGNYVWNMKIDDSAREALYNSLRRIDFNTAYLKQSQKDISKNDLFNEAFSCILTGRKMFNGTNLEIIFRQILINKNTDNQKLDSE